MNSEGGNGVLCMSVLDGTDDGTSDDIRAWVDGRMGLWAQQCIHGVQNSCPSFSQGTVLVQLSGLSRHNPKLPETLSCI